MGNARWSWIIKKHQDHELAIMISDQPSECCNQTRCCIMRQLLSLSSFATRSQKRERKGDDVITNNSCISALIESALTPTQVFLNRDGPLPYKPRHDPILRNIHSSCLRLFYDVDISLFDLIPQVLYLKLHSK